MKRTLNNIEVIDLTVSSEDEREDFIVWSDLKELFVRKEVISDVLPVEERVLHVSLPKALHIWHVLVVIVLIRPLWVLDWFRIVPQYCSGIDSLCMMYNRKLLLLEQVYNILYNYY